MGENSQRPTKPSRALCCGAGRGRAVCQLPSPLGTGVPAPQPPCPSLRGCIGTEELMPTGHFFLWNWRMMLTREECVPRCPRGGEGRALPCAGPPGGRSVSRAVRVAPELVLLIWWGRAAGRGLYQLEQGFVICPGGRKFPFRQVTGAALRPCWKHAGRCRVTQGQGAPRWGAGPGDSGWGGPGGLGFLLVLPPAWTGGAGRRTSKADAPPGLACPCVLLEVSPPQRSRGAELAAAGLVWRAAVCGGVPAEAGAMLVPPSPRCAISPGMPSPSWPTSPCTAWPGCC